MTVRDIPIRTEIIALDAFLKWSGLAATGGHAKQLVQNGAVRVNGEKETRRSRKLSEGDTVLVAGAGEFRIVRHKGEPERSG